MPSLPDHAVLLLTTTHPSWGYGHAQRIATLIKEFSKLYSNTKIEVADVLLEAKYEPCPELIKEESKHIFNNDEVKIFAPLSSTIIRSWEKFYKWQKNKFFSLVIIDRREPPPILVNFFNEIGIPIIAFDIRSSIPNSMNTLYQKTLGKITYIINTLPCLEADWANLNGWDYLFSPKQYRSMSKRNEKCVSQRVKSNPSNLTSISIRKNLFLYLGSFSNREYIAKTMAKIKHLIVLSKKHQNSILTIITNKNNHHQVRSLAETIFNNPSLVTYDLQPFNTKGISWNEVDILFTHFGLLGIEALQSGILTCFLEPTTYHTQLANKHFPKILLSRIEKIEDINEAKHHLSEDLKNIGQGYLRLLKILKKFTSLRNGISYQLNEKLSMTCDLCSGSLSIKHRRTWMNLTQCANCKGYRLQPFVSPFSSSNAEREIWQAPCEDYDSEYFISEYKKSYGKSYLEDEEAIKELAQGRIEKIHHLWRKSKNLSRGRLLDIGCAYGFFLDVAAQFNYETYGVDISQHAGEQITSHHFIQGDFLKEDTLRPWITDEKDFFDIVTLWYVIEHFPNIRAVINHIASIHTSGGVLGLSTPNAKGLSPRYQEDKFLSTSPPDHFYIFSTKGLRNLLSELGYTYAGFRPSGIHFSRFREIYPQLSWIPESLYRSWASWTNLGDTMEMYFIKE